MPVFDQTATTSSGHYPVIQDLLLAEDISPDIFDTKRNYEKANRSIFLEDRFGLVDPINRKHARLFDLMKLQKSMDWDEQEFPYQEAVSDFKRAPAGVTNRFIETLAWQWIGDSVAAHSVAPLIHPFVSDDDYWMLILEINRNEALHALTYGEIERFAFPGDAGVRLREVVANQAAIRRMNAVAVALSKVRDIGNRLNSGAIRRDSEEAIDGAMLFTCTMLGLERIEFVSSFYVSMAVGELNFFIPPVFAVQKIMLDEWNVHVPAHRYTLMSERTIPRSAKSLERIRPYVEKMWGEIASAEFAWNARQHDLKYDVPGLSERRLNDVVFFALNDLYNTAGWDNPHKVVDMNPLPFIDKWLKTDKSQGSPQETRQGMYLLGGFTEGSKETTFNIADI